MKKRLNRTIQCAKCPWKVSTNPHDIPDGYCETKHRNLKDTIAEPSSVKDLGMPIKMMACHHSTNEWPEACIGWLYNQLGVGNNISLRLYARNLENLSDIKVKGKQHEQFEDKKINNSINNPSLTMTHKIGNIYVLEDEIKGAEYYLLCQVGYGVYALINIKTANRYQDPISVDSVNFLSSKEWELVSAGEKFRLVDAELIVTV